MGLAVDEFSAGDGCAPEGVNLGRHLEGPRVVSRTGLRAPRSWQRHAKQTFNIHAESFLSKHEVMRQPIRLNNRRLSFLLPS